MRKGAHSRFIQVVSILVSMAGCVGTATEEPTSAAVVQDDTSYFYAFKDGALYEANGANGPCRMRGGCLLSSDESIDLRAIGFAPDEERSVRTHARAGRVLMLGKVQIVTYYDPMPPNPANGPMPALFTAEQVWIVPWDPFAGAPVAVPTSATTYRVNPGMTGLGGPASAVKDLVAAPLNGGEAYQFDAMTSVRQPYPGDVWNRGGLLVQGAFESQPGAEGEGVRYVLRADAYYQRWVPAAQRQCDTSCGGYRSCTQCGPDWVCGECALGE